jgi:hypothetical protein
MSGNTASSVASGQPGVSVIIPAYNYARFLPDAIDSVLAQTYPSVVCIVVDDGSTDATPAVCRGYGARIRYVRQANQGLSATRNNGMRLADTPLVAFLDADDRLLPEFVARLVAVLDEAGADTAVAACATEYIDEQGKPWPQQRPQPSTACFVSERDILYKTRFPPSAVLARRDVLLGCGGFDTELRSSEDRDMWVRVCSCQLASTESRRAEHASHIGPDRNPPTPQSSQYPNIPLPGVAASTGSGSPTFRSRPIDRLRASHFRVRWIPERLVQMRKHGASMSRDPERMMSNGRRVLEKARAASPVPAWRFDYWNRFFAFHAYESAWMFHDAGRRGQALQCLARSVLLWPLPFPHRALGEPVLFRLRALRRFVAGKGRLG